MTANAKTPVWYLSFVDETGWLGGCFVAAETEVGAVSEAWRRGCNPGGEVGIMGPLPPQVPAGWMNRILSREEIEGNMEESAS